MATTITRTTYDNREITVTLRPSSEIDAEPNMFVSAEVFEQYKAEAGSYTREKIIAEYEEIKQLALLSGQHNVARQTFLDILRIKLADPDCVLTKEEQAYLNRTAPSTPQPSPPPPTDEDLPVLPSESDNESPIRDGPYKDNHSDSYSDPPGDSDAESQEKEPKTIRSLTAKLCKDARDPPKDVDRDMMFVSLQTLRVGASRRGTLNLARLALLAQCQVCDIPSLEDRESAISRQQQKSEAAEQTAAVAVKEVSPAATDGEATTLAAEKPTEKEPFVWPADVIIDELVQKHLKLERTAKRVPYTERYNVKIIPRNQKTKHELEVEHEQNYDLTIDTHPLDEPMPPKPKDHPYPDDLDPPRIIPDGMDRYLGWNLIDRNGEALPDWCWCYMDYRRENWRKHPLRKPVELTEEQKQQKALHDAYEKRLAKEERNRKWRKAFLPPDLQ